MLVCIDVSQSLDRVGRIAATFSLLLALLVLLHDAEPLQAQAVAPSVTRVEITSNAVADSTYALGETIRVTVRFSEAVVVTGAPRIAIDMDPADWGQKWAAYEAGSGTASLTFTHTVVEPNHSTQGIAVLANSLQFNGGSIVSSSSQTPVALGHAQLGHDANHKVDWRLLPGQSNRAPVVNRNAPSYRGFVRGQSVVRGRLVSKSYAGMFSDPEGDTLSYSVSVPEHQRSLVDKLLTTRRPGVRGGGERSVWTKGGIEMVLFQADAEDDWGAMSPALADPQNVTVMVTATDPDGLTATVSGDFVVDWDSRPELQGVVGWDRAIVLTYDRALRADSVPRAEQFTLHVDQDDSTAGRIEVSEVSLSGAVVTLALASALEPGQTVTLDYTHDAASFLQRAAGGDPAPSFSGRAVAVATHAHGPDYANLEVNRQNAPPSANPEQSDQALATRPTVIGVEITSDPGSDDIYELGDTIQISLRFSEAVEVTGSPRLKIDMDPADWGEKLVPYESGSGTDTLTFGHIVVEPNYSMQGIAVLADSLALNGGAIRSTTSELDADLAHARMAHDGEHRVNWKLAARQLQVAAPTVTEVTISSDAGSDRSYAKGEVIRVSLRWTEAVNVTGAPRLKLDFRTGDGDEQWASYESGSDTRTLVFAYTVAAGDDSQQGVALPANTLELNGGTIVSASIGGGHALLTHTGLLHDADHRVDCTEPTLLSAVAEGTTLTLTFDEALGAAASLTNDQFAVVRRLGGGSEESIGLTRAPVISSVSVTLTLTNAMPEADAEVRVSYIKPTTGVENRLIDIAGNEVESFSDVSAMRDTTPPRLVSGQIDGGTLIMVFSEALDETSIGGWFRARIKFPGGATIHSTASGAVQIQGNKVTVGLGGGRVALAGVTTNHAYYIRDGSPDAKVLRDLAGNPVEAPFDRSGYYHTPLVTLENITVGPPRVAWVELSSDPGEDKTYELGDTISVRVKFNQPVLVVGSPRIKIGFDSGVGARLGDEKWAIYSSGSGTSVLEFSYTVTGAVNSSNRSTKGINVFQSTLTGGTIRSVKTSMDAERAHAGLGHDANHKVEIAQRVKRAELHGTTLTIHFHKPLGAAPSLTNGAFVVKKAMAGGSVQTVGLRGAPLISGHTLTLKLTSTTSPTDNDVSISYTKPGSGTGNRLVDEAGVELASFSGQPVGSDVTPPTLIRGEVDGEMLTLVFNEPLNERHDQGHYFRVRLNDMPFSHIEFPFRSDVQISGHRLTVRMGYAGVYFSAKAGLNGDNRAYYYKYDDTRPGLRDLAGNEVSTPHQDRGFWATRWVPLENLSQ